MGGRDYAAMALYEGALGAGDLIAYKVRGSTLTLTLTLTLTRPEYERLSQAVIPQATAAEPGQQAEAEHLAQLCTVRRGATTLCSVVEAATLCTGCRAACALSLALGSSTARTARRISGASAQPSRSLTRALP